MPPSARTIVVGGGLAGLACARELGEDCLLVEAADRLGGLLRTEVAQGFSFDWTGHWLHARDPAMRALIQERWLAGNLLEVQRRARIFSEGVWTDFPYQFNLHGLPPETVAECLLGFVEATLGEGGRALRERKLENAAEFIVRHLGQGLARRFMFPYNQKLYTVPCEELSPEWGGRFIPRPSLEDLVRGAAGAPLRGAGYNATFWYPREGGIESLARGVAADLRGQVRLRTRAVSLDLAARKLRVVTDAGPGGIAAGGARGVAEDVETELSFENLVLTLPLPAATRLLVDAPEPVRAAAALLRSVSVTVVEVGAADNGGERFHWAYFPEERFPFFRIGSPSEVNPRLAPPGMRSFAVEFAHRGPSDHAALIEQALRGLEGSGLVDRAQVELARARTIPVAYVLFDHAHAAARATVLEHLAAHGVQVAGRYGRWEYSSMEDALLSGREAARQLL